MTPEYRAEQERVSDDSVITNNKTYGTVKIVQPQVIGYLFIRLYLTAIINGYIDLLFLIVAVQWYNCSNESQHNRSHRFDEQSRHRSAFAANRIDKR